MKKRNNHFFGNYMELIHHLQPPTGRGTFPRGCGCLYLYNSFKFADARIEGCYLTILVCHLFFKYCDGLVSVGGSLSRRPSQLRR